MAPTKESSIEVTSKQVPASTMDIMQFPDPSTGTIVSWIDHTGAGQGNLAASGSVSGIQAQSYTYADDTGAANAYAVTLSPAPSIVEGSYIAFKALHSNTTASTIAVNGGAATPIKKAGSAALASGDIVAGEIYQIIYDGTNWQVTSWPGTGGGGGSVTSVFGRTGAVVATSNDYSVSQLSGLPVTVAQGGTGLTTIAAHDVLVGAGTGNIVPVSPGTSGFVFTSNGTSADPSFQAVPGAAVSSVFGRTGTVAAQSGDYTAAQVTGAASQVGVQDESYTYATDTGTANTYAIAPSPAPGAYVTGMAFVFAAANANTGASTLNVNSLGAKAIKKWSGAVALVSGDIAAGQIIRVVYDGTNFQLGVPVAGTGGGDNTAEYIIGTADSNLPNALVWPGLYNSPDAPPASPTTFDYEFDDNAFSITPGSTTYGNWTMFNGDGVNATPTGKVNKSWLSLWHRSEGSADVLRGITESLPVSTPWEFTAKVGLNLVWSASNGLFFNSGLCLRESSTSKLVLFGWSLNSSITNAGLTLQVQAWTNNTTFNAENWRSAQQVFTGVPMYLRVYHDGTNIHFSLSWSGFGNATSNAQSATAGVDFVEVASFSKTLYFTTNPNQIGFAADANSISGVTICDWIRRTA